MDANEIAFELLSLKEDLGKLEFDREDNIKDIKIVESKLTEAINILHSLKDE